MFPVKCLFLSENLVFYEMNSIYDLIYLIKFFLVIFNEKMVFKISQENVSNLFIMNQDYPIQVKNLSHTLIIIMTFILENLLL